MAKMKMKEPKAQLFDEGEMTLNELVGFPSRDGFPISLDMTVEFEFDPSDIAGIYRRYGDLPAVIDKIIMPQITSISRNKGSEYRAKDFIVTVVFFAALDFVRGLLLVLPQLLLLVCHRHMRGLVGGVAGGGDHLAIRGQGRGDGSKTLEGFGGVHLCLKLP